jgi:hypothetical protein
MSIPGASFSRQARSPFSEKTLCRHRAPSQFASAANRTCAPPTPTPGNTHAMFTRAPSAKTQKFFGSFFQKRTLSSFSEE